MAARRKHDVALVFAERVGKKFDYGLVKTTVAVTGYLSDLADDQDQALEDRDAIEYSVESSLEPDEYFTQTFDEDSEEWLLRDGIVNLDAMEHLGASEIEDTRFAFYAIVVGNSRQRRTAYVRKRNPVKIATQGKRFFEFSDTLTDIENPLLLIEGSFDLILRPGSIDILNPNVFENLLYEATGINELIGDWIGEISTTLPMANSTIELLTKTCQQKFRARRRLQAIQARGHLQKVTIKHFEAEVRRHGLDPKDYIKGGKIEAAVKDHAMLMTILNEDLFSGGFSSERFLVERKSVRK